MECISWWIAKLTPSLRRHKRRFGFLIYSALRVTRGEQEATEVHRVSVIGRSTNYYGGKSLATIFRMQDKLKRQRVQKLF